MSTSFVSVVPTDGSLQVGLRAAPKLLEHLMASGSLVAPGTLKERPYMVLCRSFALCILGATMHSEMEMCGAHEARVLLLCGWQTMTVMALSLARKWRLQCRVCRDMQHSFAPPDRPKKKCLQAIVHLCHTSMCRALCTALTRLSHSPASAVAQIMAL
jgi:hypothetical protein